MVGNRRVFGRGLPRIALGLFVTLIVALGLTCGLAPNEALGGEELPLQALGGEELPLQAQGGEELPLQAQKLPESYNLWVDGTSVTDDNKDDVLKGTANEGKVSFSLAEDGASATLTLNGANITTGHVFNDGENVSHSYGIYYTGENPLTIAVTSNSAVDVSNGEADTVAGIFCEYSGLTLTGEGKLTVTGVAEGISGLGDVTIDKGVVEATGLNGAINARAGNVVITNDSTVETNGSINGKRVAINSGIVKASGESSGIFGDSVTIRGGEVTATASNGNGIAANSTNDGPGTVTISGGTVIATGGANGSGIYTENYGGHEPPGIVTIDGSIASVIASGGKQAIEGIVTNAVAGMGWTDAAGTTGKEAIAASVEGGQALSYKKVRFPTPVAEVVEKPEPTNPTYDSKAQALVTAGAAEGGAMWYSLDGETWSDEVPTGTDVGAYAVWYKAVGDDQHADSEPQKVTSTIAKEDEPADALDLSGSGHEQSTGDAVARTKGNGIVIGTTGESKRLEQFSVALPEGTDGSIEYRGHLQSKGWVDWSKDGAPCGTTSESRRVEAVQMQLSGAVADDYSVWYRAHVQNMGWLGWACDGQAAGTAGQSLRAEAIEVQVLPKGQVPEGYVEREASYVGAVSANVHLQNQGWTGASSAIEFGTTGQSCRLEAVRLSGPATPVSAGISYEVHVQNRGWLPPVADGALAGTTGQSRRLEAVRISLTGNAAGEGEYSVWYRVHSQNQGWLGWACDGAPAGTTGLSKRAEAIDVQILPQGQVPRGYDGSAACVSR